MYFLHFCVSCGKFAKRRINVPFYFCEPHFTTIKEIKKKIFNQAIIPIVALSRITLSKKRKETQFDRLFFTLLPREIPTCPRMTSKGISNYY
jgi:hypothetical protein